MVLASCRVLNLPCGCVLVQAPSLACGQEGLSACVSTPGGFINCLSVALIKYHNQKQLKEEGVYFSLWLQRGSLWYGRGKNDTVAGGSNCWLVMLSCTVRKQKERLEVRSDCNPQSPPPVEHFSSNPLKGSTTHTNCRPSVQTHELTEDVSHLNHHGYPGHTVLVQTTVGT